MPSSIDLAITRSSNGVIAGVLIMSGSPREKPKSPGPHWVMSTSACLAAPRISSRFSTATSFSIMIESSTDSM